VKSRLSGLQTGSSEELCVAGTFDRLRHTEAIAIERQAHEALKDQRIRGEWFDIAADEAIKVLWSLVDSQVYIARFMATKDLRGHVAPETIEKIAQRAHSGIIHA
jgi:hypothetical protein